jgi:hypothetical protein
VDIVLCGLLSRLPSIDVGCIGVCNDAVIQGLEQKAVLGWLLRHELLKRKAAAPDE